MNTTLAAVVIFTVCMGAWYAVPWAGRLIVRKLGRPPRRARTIAPRPVQATGRHRALEAGPDAQPASRWRQELNQRADTAQQAMAAAVATEEGR